MQTFCVCPMRRNLLEVKNLVKSTLSEAEILLINARMGMNTFLGDNFKSKKET